MWQTAIEHMESKFGVTLSSAADWALSAALLVGAAVAALLLHTAALFVARRLMGERWPFLRTVLSATKGPTRLALLLIALAVMLPQPISRPTPRNCLSASSDSPPFACLGGSR